MLKLAAKFVPAADEVYRMQNLQTGTDPECRLFQKFAELGHYRQPGTTRQGTYCVSPSGVLLGSINSNDPKRIADLLERSLAKWETLSREERLLPTDPRETTGRHQAARAVLPGGRPGAERDLARHAAAKTAKGERQATRRTGGRLAWNQDFAWFTKAEARQFLPPEPKVGQKQDLPAPLLHRIACAHLIDNVRGQTSPFEESQVKKARLTTEVTAVDGNMVSLRLEGETLTADGGPAQARPRHAPARESDVRPGQGALPDVRAGGRRLALGRTQLNGRRGDTDPAPIGILFTLAGGQPVRAHRPGVQPPSGVPPGRVGQMTTPEDGVSPRGPEHATYLRLFARVEVPEAVHQLGRSLSLRQKTATRLTLRLFARADCATPRRPTSADGLIWPWYATRAAETHSMSPGWSVYLAGGPSMRLGTIFLLAQLLPVAAVLLSAPAAAPRTIVIDGKFDDWKDVPAYKDPPNNEHDTDHKGRDDKPEQVEHPDVDLVEYKLTHDADNLYAYFKARGVIGRTQAAAPTNRPGAITPSWPLTSMTTSKPATGCTRVASIRPAAATTSTPSSNGTAAASTPATTTTTPAATRRAWTRRCSTNRPGSTRKGTPALTRRVSCPGAGHVQALHRMGPARQRHLDLRARQGRRKPWACSPAPFRRTGTSWK